MTRSNLKSLTTLLFTATLLTLTLIRANAASFASAVTNNNGTIQFILNQKADNNGVFVLFDNGSVSNLLVGQTNTGLQTFPLGSHTNFAIYVTTTGTGTPGQLSSDANANSVWGSPRGVASIYNAKLGYQFGRLFVDNSSTAGKGKGVFMLNADESSSAAGLGPFTTGVWNSSASSPYRMYSADDGTLYVGDFATASATVWQFDGNLNKFTNQVLAIVGETGGVAAGTHGDIVGEPMVLGSVSNGNMVLFTADPGLAAGTLATNGSGGLAQTLGFRTSANTYNNVYRYTIGANPLPFTNAPDLAIGMGLGSIPELMIDVAVHKATGNIYGMFDRGNFAAPCLQVFDPTGTTRLFTSMPDALINIGPDPLANAFCIAISPDGRYVGIETINNALLIMNITNGVPDLSSLVTIANTPTTGNGRGICWDAADNVYAVSSGQTLLRIWSLGNSSTCVTANDSTGANGSFQLLLPPITASVVASAPIASQNFGTPVSGAFTITLSTNFLASPLTVHFTTGGTATNGTFIASVTNSVTFPSGTSLSGNWSTNITVTPTLVPVTGPVLTVTALVTGGAGYLTAPPLLATVTIANTGPQSFSISPIPLQSPAPVLTLGGSSNTTIYRGIANDFVPMVITRLGNTNGPLTNTAGSITLTNFIYGGTAIYGVDYLAGVQSGATPVNGGGSVTFAPGDISKTVLIGNPVPTPFGAPAVGDKTITISLSAGAPSLEGYTYSVTGSAANFVELDNSFGPEFVLWSDPLTNGLTGTNWTLTFASTNLGSATVLPILLTNYNNISPGAATNNYTADGNGTNDFDVEFGYTVAKDKVAQSLAMTAKGWTNALKMTVNKDPNILSAAGVNVYPQGQFFAGNYALRFNMMLVEGTFSGSFSSEFATFGINHYGTNCNWIGADVKAGAGSGTTNADGSWAAVGSDQGAAPGGTPADLALYNGAKKLPNTGFVETVSAVENTFSNVFRHPSPLTANGLSPAGLPTTAGIGSPANIGNKTANTWVDVELKQYQGTHTLSIDKSVILSFVNTNVFTNGTIMLGYDDPFFNQSDVGAVYYSNVRVVELAPAVTNGPNSVVVNPGGAGAFTIGAVGTAPFTNQLFVSNGLAVGSPIVSSTPADAATFAVPNLQFADATNYYIVVSDAAGSITSAVSTVTVVTPPANVTNYSGETVAFAPVLTGPANTNLFYQWSTNGVNLTNGNHYAGATASTLTITNIQISDALTYTVVVSNAFGFSTTNSAVLSVSTTAILSPTFTGITYNQTNATLRWTSPNIFDSTNSFFLESSTNVYGPYTNTAAAFTLSNGVFQIVLPQTNAAEFYYLKHK